MAVLKNFSTALALLAGLSLATAADAQVFGGNGLSLALGRRQLTISGATQGGQVLVAGTMSLAVGRVPFVWQDQVLLTDDDQDGVVTWDAPWPIPELAAFAAADLATGVYGTYAGYEPAARVVELASPAVITRVVTEEIYFSLTAGSAKTVLMLRAGQGVWQGQAESQVSEVGEFEGNTIEQVTAALSPAMMEPLGGSAVQPPAPQVGDVLLVIDPSSAQLAIRQLDSNDFVSQ